MVSETDSSIGHSCTFDYAALKRGTAERVRASAERVREKVKKTLEDVIDVGTELAKVKGLLGHGLFGRWLQAEFGWPVRRAENFLSVAEHFGPKYEIIANLAIQPTAASLLASPSVPEAARRAAIERAESGQRVTTAVAREIVADVRKEHRRVAKRLGTKELRANLTHLLRRYHDRWERGDVTTLVRLLREFADELEAQSPGTEAH
jgi:DNA-binding transcriptional regulator YdaS (Cro superfamily)